MAQATAAAAEQSGAVQSTVHAHMGVMSGPTRVVAEWDEERENRRLTAHKDDRTRIHLAQPFEIVTYI